MTLEMDEDHLMAIIISILERINSILDACQTRILAHEIELDNLKTTLKLQQEQINSLKNIVMEHLV